jgi:glycopeptide antibiotics resistance protein
MLVTVTVILGTAFAVISFMPARVRLPLWCIVIAGAVVPWLWFQDHAHWDRVQWIPFVAPPDLRLRDVVINVVMYIPFGLFFVRAGGTGPRVTAVVVWAVLFSILTEGSQAFSHGRFPTATDVTMNAAGAMVGAVLGRRVSFSASERA